MWRPFTPTPRGRPLPRPIVRSYSPFALPDFIRDRQADMRQPPYNGAPITLRLNRPRYAVRFEPRSRVDTLPFTVYMRTGKHQIRLHMLARTRNIVGALGVVHAMETPYKMSPAETEKRDAWRRLHAARMRE